MPQPVSRIRDVGAPPVVERVEEDADVVVLGDVVALGHGCAYFARLVNSVEGDVEKFVVVAEIEKCRLRGRGVVARIDLVNLRPSGESV